MDENDSKPKKGRRWLIIGVAALVVVLILAALMIFDFATSGTRQATPASPTTTEPVAGGAGITVGSGGTKTGADGVTKIGYAGTCDGAVQAATNYYKGLTDVYRVSDEKKIELINQVVLPGTTKDALVDDANRRTAVVGTPEGKEIAKGYTETVHVEWGGSYKISDCTSERTATIQILECKVSTIDPAPQQKIYTTCGTDLVRLLWTNGDWKVVSLNDYGQGGFALNVTEKIPGWEPSPEKLPMPASIRDAYLKQSATGTKDEGWIDYAGITRK